MSEMYSSPTLSPKLAWLLSTAQMDSLLTVIKKDAYSFVTLWMLLLETKILRPVSNLVLHQITPTTPRDFVSPNAQMFLNSLPDKVTEFVSKDVLLWSMQMSWLTNVKTDVHLDTLLMTQHGNASKNAQKVNSGTTAPTNVWQLALRANFTSATQTQACVNASKIVPMVLSLTRTTTDNADHTAWLQGFQKIRQTHANWAAKQASQTKELVSALPSVPQVTTATREFVTKTNVQVSLRRYSLTTFQICAFPNARMEALGMFPLVSV